MDIYTDKLKDLKDQLQYLRCLYIFVGLYDRADTCAFLIDDLDCMLSNREDDDDDDEIR